MKHNAIQNSVDLLSLFINLFDLSYSNVFYFIKLLSSDRDANKIHALISALANPH